MKGIRQVTGVAAPLLRDNIDTDAIIPSREMKSTGKTGFADGLFAAWRYLGPGSREPNPDFVLNEPAYAGAAILLGGGNFGSGSSREHAVWALKEFGIRAIVAPSFAPIFRNNCLRNFLVPAILPRAVVEEIAAATATDPRQTPVTVDVAAQSVSLPGGRSWTFPLEPQAVTMLLEGKDVIDLTLKHRDEIAAFQERDRTDRPWIYLGDAA